MAIRQNLLSVPLLPKSQNIAISCLKYGQAANRSPGLSQWRPLQ
jgi:hypothetical protein